MKNILKIVKNSLNWANKSTPIKTLLVGIIVSFCLLGVTMPKAATCIDLSHTFSNTASASYVVKESNNKKIAKTIKVVVTAYSSTHDQTDDTPFITASGKYVADGIVANNLLPFGTKIKIPALYGDKIFTVQDRMSKKKGNYHLDIWMPARNLAIDFGAKTTEIEILEN